MLKRIWLTGLAFVVLVSGLAVESLVLAADSIPQNEVTVNALAYYQTVDGESHGACFPIRVTTGGMESKRVRVGFFESEVGGTGDKWKAAGWMAAVSAAQLTDFHPASMQVSFEVQGRIDGPSGGGLMTVAILAAIRGDTVRADAAMTGTINPDGMIGPVGGIPHKIEGAAEAGKKLVVIPMTSEMEVDRNTKKLVNLVQHGQKFGVEVRSVVDIYEAYELMTGVSLPRPSVGGRPTPNAKIDRLVAKNIGNWAGLIETALDRYNKSPKDTHTEYTEELVKMGKDLINSANKLMREGAVQAAYSDMITAATNIYAARENADSHHTFDLVGLDGMIERINNNGWLQSEIDKTAVALRFSVPKSMNQLVLYFDAVDCFIEALTYQKMAQIKLASLPDDEEKKELAALTAAEWQNYAYLDCKITVDQLESMKQFGGKPIPADAPVLETAQFYRRAADASLDVFDSLTISGIADSLKLDKAVVKARLSQKDESFGLMHVAHRLVIPQLEEYLGDGPQLGYAKMAGSIYLHAQAALLIAKYYSLDAQLDDDLFVTSVGREQSFNEWLSASDDQARRNIMLLSQHGIDTSTCASGYEMAKTLRYRDVSDKLKALQIFFYLNVQTKVLQRLGGATLGALNSPSRAVPSNNDDVAPPAIPANTTNSKSKVGDGKGTQKERIQGKIFNRQR